jgi:dCTP deaminase
LRKLDISAVPRQHLPMTAADSTPGVLSDRALARAIGAGWIIPGAALSPNQIQPASLDLRLGKVAYRVRASFLPGAARVQDWLDDGLVMHRIDLTQGAVLEKGCVYVAPLMESLTLPADIHGAANPKSSTGRLDVFTRMIVDGADAFDLAPAAYRGPLFAEISPCTFSILAKEGARLSQLRLRRGPPQTLREELFRIGFSSDGIAGYRAKRHAGVIDLDRVGAYDPKDFWEPLYARDGRLVLDPGEFYIFASHEDVVIPPREAAEMAPIRPELGEFRAHYAGFFDPGFGVAPQSGKAVLEVRSRDVPFIVENRQPVGRLVFEPLSEPAALLYGESGSSYQGQGLKLAKQFKPWG